MTLRRRPKPRPAPVIDRADHHPVRQPATPERCAEDYATGADARQHLGKPSEDT